MRIAQGDPEQAEGAALGLRSIFGLAPRRGAAIPTHSPQNRLMRLPCAMRPPCTRPSFPFRLGPCGRRFLLRSGSTRLPGAEVVKWQTH